MDESTNTSFDIGRALGLFLFIVVAVILIKFIAIINWGSILSPLLLGVSLLFSLSLSLIALIKLRYTVMSEAVRLGWVLLVLLFPLLGAISLLIVKPGSEINKRNL